LTGTGGTRGVAATRAWQELLDEAAARAIEGLRCIRLADSSSSRDNDAILTFVESRTMAMTGLVVNYARRPDYFAFLRMQGDTSVVFLQEDEQGDLKGLGSFAYRTGLVDGNTARIGYVGDLRVAAYRLGQVQWRKVYATHLARARDAGVVAHYTAILDDNLPARRALVEEASLKNGYVYDPLLRYGMVNVLGRVPIPRRARGPTAAEAGILVRRARASDEAKLISFLVECERSRLFGEDFSTVAWSFRLNRWPNFALEDFLVAVAPAGDIVGCTLPWSPRGAKSVVVERLPPMLKALRHVLNATGAQPRVPAQGEHLEFLYLTHLRFGTSLAQQERVAALESFLLEARRTARAQGYHFVSFQDATIGAMAPALARRGWLCQRVPATLYSVRERERPREAFVEEAISGRREVAFEMALI
jgi:hypothetical protein